MSERVLEVEPLTRAAFAPYGDVIEPGAARAVFEINAGTATRYHDLAKLDPGLDGRLVASLFRAEPRALPFEIAMLERHPLGTQAFMPLSDAPYLVVVGYGAAGAPRVFRAQGQGVNFKKGVWHHPLFALERTSDFLVLDRDGEGDNCDEIALDERWRIDTVG